MSDIWSRFVDLLVTAWSYAGDWYPWAAGAAALFGGLVCVREYRAFKREIKK